VILAGLGVLAFAAVAIFVGVVAPKKLSAAGTERDIHRYTTYKSITCSREAGRFWRGWDYRCEGRAGDQCDVFDVDVNGSEVTNQDGPGDCRLRP
jgi:hypothetical protein